MKKTKHLKKQTPSRKNKKKPKYRIHYDVGALCFGVLSLIGAILPHQILIKMWMEFIQIQSHIDRYIYWFLGTLIYNLWFVALWLGYLAVKKRMKNGKVVIGVLFGLLSLGIIVLRYHYTQTLVE